MARTDVHIKIVLDHERDDNVEKLAAEICRQVQKVYAVKSATVSNIVAHEDE